MTQEDRNKRRNRKYKLLRQAGYNNEDASKYKDLSNWKVIQLIEAREEFNETLELEYKLLDIEIQAILKGGLK